MLDFRQIALLCLGYRLSKHKITICSEHFGGHGPLGHLGYAYAQKLTGYDSFSSQCYFRICIIFAKYETRVESLKIVNSNRFLV